MTDKKTGVELIAEERKEQIEVHCFNVQKDSAYYKNGELKRAALFAILLSNEIYPETWDTWFMNKMRDKEMRLSPVEFDIERLKIAGALIAAEIDRLQSL
jgi:hypothetical protein